MNNSGKSRWVCVKSNASFFTVGKIYQENEKGWLFDDVYNKPPYSSASTAEEWMKDDDGIKFINVTFSLYLNQAEQCL